MDQDTSCQFDENLYTRMISLSANSHVNKNTRQEGEKAKYLKIPACIANCLNQKIIINLSPWTHVRTLQFLDETDMKTNLHLDRVKHSVKKENFGIKLRQHQHKQDIAS